MSHWYWTFGTFVNVLYKYWIFAVCVDVLLLCSYKMATYERIGSSSLKGVKRRKIYFYTVERIQNSILCRKCFWPLCRERSDQKHSLYIIVSCKRKARRPKTCPAIAGLVFFKCGVKRSIYRITLFEKSLFYQISWSVNLYRTFDGCATMRMSYY